MNCVPVLIDSLKHKVAVWRPKLGHQMLVSHHDFFCLTFTCRSEVKWIVSIKYQCLHYFWPQMHFYRPSDTRLAYSKWILTARESNFDWNFFPNAFDSEIWILERYVPRYALMSWLIASIIARMTIANANVLAMKLFVSTVSLCRRIYVAPWSNDLMKSFCRVSLPCWMLWRL